MLWRLKRKKDKKKRETSPGLTFLFDKLMYDKGSSIAWVPQPAVKACFSFINESCQVLSLGTYASTFLYCPNADSETIACVLLGFADKRES